MLRDCIVKYTRYIVKLLISEGCITPSLKRDTSGHKVLIAAPNYEYSLRSIFYSGRKTVYVLGIFPESLFPQSSKSQTANMIYFKTVIFSSNLSYIDMKSSVRATWTMYFLAMSIIFPCHEFPMSILGRGPNTLLTFFR